MFIRCARHTMLLAALALMIPFSALAESKNHCNVSLPETMQVGTTQLQAGTYRVEWQGNGSTLNVSFLKDGKTVATTEGKMIEKKNRAEYDQILTRKEGTTKKLDEIDFGGKKNALMILSNQTAVK